MVPKEMSSVSKVAVGKKKGTSSRHSKGGQEDGTVTRHCEIMAQPPWIENTSEGRVHQSSVLQPAMINGRARPSTGEGEAGRM